jgi:hypothetical protein
VNDFRIEHITAKLMAGKPYFVATDNPATVKRMLALAEELGASIEEFVEGDGMTTILLRLQRH